MEWKELDTWRQYQVLSRRSRIKACTTNNQFFLRMGTELVPETLYSNELTRLCAREDYIECTTFVHSGRYGD
jgi:hypothetical protein